MGLQDRKISRYINDFSGVLDIKSENIKNAEELFFYHYEACEEQIITIIIPSLEGQSLKKVGMEFFDKNGFGEKEKDTGLLLVIAEKEKKLRIIAGKGLKGKYPIYVLRDIVDNQLRGLVNIGDYERLLEVWLKVTTNNDERKESTTEISKRWPLSLVLLLMIFGCFALIFAYVFFLGVTTVLCVLYYYDIVLFLVLSVGGITFLYTLYLYIRNVKGGGKHTYLILGVFIGTLLSVFIRYGIVEIGPEYGTTVSHQSEKENKPEWCKISKGGVKSNERKIEKEDVRKSLKDNTKSLDVNFGGGGFSDGYGFGD